MKLSRNCTSGHMARLFLIFLGGHMAYIMPSIAATYDLDDQRSPLLLD